MATSSSRLLAPLSPLHKSSSIADVNKSISINRRTRLPTSIQVLRMVWREWAAPFGLERTPEPQAMNEADVVKAFDEEGKPGGVMLPAYLLNALALSDLLPENGTLLDLGSGSGQFLRFFSVHRPDVKIIGIDLSKKMVALGTKQIQQAGFSDRIELRVGDMTKLDSLAKEKPDVVSTIFSLHHLPTTQHLELCLECIGRLREQTGCGFWCFDHVRPRLKRTAEEFPALITPSASPTFQQSSHDSLLAAFTFEELTGHCSRGFKEISRSLCSNLLRLYQTHWLEPKETKNIKVDHSPLWKNHPLDRKTIRDYRSLKKLLPEIPGHSSTNF